MENETLCCKTFRGICKFVNIGLGSYIIVLAILRFIFQKYESNQVTYNLLNVYFISFGLIIILAEFDIPFIVDTSFSFMKQNYGKGSFMIL